MTFEQAHGIRKAVIYCRVSHASQEKKGDGLASQEVRCREYAKFRGYEVVEVFHETLTGAAINRPAMTALLSYLRQHRKEGRVVLIDDISRFARHVVAHWHLREDLQKAGAVLESPSIEFKADSHSRFVETVLAGGAQYQREKNAEQTRDRMRSRVMAGYWPFSPCFGYRHEQVTGHKGKILVRDEPVASIVQEALEGFASGRFQTQGEVKRFLDASPGFPKDDSGEVRWQYITPILKNALYAGLVEMPKWGVAVRQGQHEGLISLQTFQRIQERLMETAKAPARADLNADFPLRGTLACASCGKPMTACWSTSKTKVRHPYYLCPHKGCAAYRKSIRRDVIETAFERELGRLAPTQRFIDLAAAMFRDAWNQRLAQAASVAQTCKREAAKLGKQIDELLDRLVEASSQTVISAYEKRIAELEREKLALLEKGSAVGQPRASFEESFELAMKFLSQPLKLWKSGRFEHKMLVLRLTFAERLVYCPVEGLRTPKTTLPFKALRCFSHKKADWRARKDSNL